MSRLTGKNLLAKARELGDLSKSEIVRGCGYVSIKENGEERLNFVEFHDALAQALSDEAGAVENKELISNAINTLRVKQGRYSHKISGSERWERNCENGNLFIRHLGKDGKTILTGRCIVIGTHCTKTNTWLWGWSNHGSNWPRQIIAQSYQLKSISAKYGCREFKIDEQFPVSDEDITRILALSVEYLNADSFYCGDNLYCAVFFADNECQHQALEIEREAGSITINGNKYACLPDHTYYELMFWHYNAERNYPHLDPVPYHEDWEFEEEDSELESHHRDMSTIDLPILLDEDGDEMEPDEVIELFEIDKYLVATSTRYENNQDVEEAIDIAPEDMLDLIKTTRLS
jgi:hypothetical protein